MKLNLEKTKAMLSPNPVLTFFPQFKLQQNGSFIRIVINQFLSFNSLVAYVVEKAQKRYFSPLQLKKECRLHLQQTSGAYFILHIFALF